MLMRNLKLRINSTNNLTKIPKKFIYYSPHGFYVLIHTAGSNDDTASRRSLFQGKYFGRLFVVKCCK